MERAHAETTTPSGNPHAHPRLSHLSLSHHSPSRAPPPLGGSYPNAAGGSFSSGRLAPGGGGGSAPPPASESGEGTSNDRPPCSLSASAGAIPWAVVWRGRREGVARGGAGAGRCVTGAVGGGGGKGGRWLAKGRWRAGAWGGTGRPPATMRREGTSEPPTPTPTPLHLQTGAIGPPHRCHRADRAHRAEPLQRCRGVSGRSQKPG